MSDAAMGLLFSSCCGTAFMAIGAAILFGLGGALLSIGAGIMMYAIAASSFHR